ncbi:MAG: ABC transporter ATP-binding protein [Alphaproteobacteria bacterium]|nr:ABC transporter ATP-binding protein [Alphaproteobacteria bacterium]
MTGKLVLSVTGLTVRFGGVSAVSDLSLRVDDGEIVSLIGPNGAGKTTLLNAVSGFLALNAGTVAVAGRNVTGEPPHQRMRLGIGRTFQHARLLDELTVLENILVGGYSGPRRTSFVAEWLRLPWMMHRLCQKRAEALALLDALKLSSLANVKVGEISFGRKKLVDLARALMTKPRLLLMDEPTAGLSEAEIERLVGVIKQIRATVAILLVAHHMKFVANVADRVVCLAAGRVIAEGPPQEVQTNPRVLAAYIGTA